MTAQVPILNLRSGTADKRPAASGLAFGQIALNYNQTDPAIYLRGHSDDLVKVAPVFVSTTAPNASPASGGASGNSVGEQWMDTTGGDYCTKVYDGTAWRSPVITSALIKDGTIVDGDINASAAISLSKLATGALPSAITVNSDNIANGTIVNADISSSAAIALAKLETDALPAGITVNSSNIVDDSIVDADINSSAAISLSKLATGSLPAAITVSSLNIVDGTIVDADISNTAGITDIKLATISSAGKVSGSSITSGTISGSTSIDTSGAVTTSAAITDGAGNVRTAPQNAQSASYTLAASDSGKHVSITSGSIAVNAGVFSPGDVVSVFNNKGGDLTITQGSSVTLRQSGTANTGNRTLGQYGVATILCVASNTFVITGGGLS